MKATQKIFNKKKKQRQWKVLLRSQENLYFSPKNKLGLVKKISKIKKYVGLLVQAGIPKPGIQGKLYQFTSRKSLFSLFSRRYFISPQQEHFTC